MILVDHSSSGRSLGQVTLMSKRAFILAMAVMVVGVAGVQAGQRIQVTAGEGAEAVTYDVDFGGGKLMEKFTAWDPAGKKFVYLNFPRRGNAPKPAGTIWDFRSGETISLYSFPGVDQPLPVIPSADDLKICPKTGKKITEKKTKIFYD